MYCEILSSDSIIAGHLLVYATAFLAPVVILCDTKLACVRGRPDSLLFLIPGEERFRSKASTTISVGSEFSSENQNLALTFAELCLLKMMRGHHVSSFEKSEARTIKMRFLGFAAFVIVSIGKRIDGETSSCLMFSKGHI